MAAFYRNLSKNIFQFCQIKCAHHSALLGAGKIMNSSSVFSNSSASASISLYSTNAKLSDVNKKLLEFFDSEKNWDENEVKVGRSWTEDDLRIKSNEDLHKLWFVLLKERNMLLTMEQACKDEVELFPSPERIDKVEESMSNLEAVVRERNVAYYELETGETGERPGKLVYNQLGLRYFYRMSEHLIPQIMNRSWREKYKFGYSGKAVHKFLRLYREKLYLRNRRERSRNMNYVQRLLKHVPSLDMEAVQDKYPTVNIQKANNCHKSDGNYERNS